METQWSTFPIYSVHKFLSGIYKWPGKGQRESTRDGARWAPWPLERIEVGPHMRGCSVTKFTQLFCDAIGEGNGTPLQYSCLENPMDGGAW